MGARVVVAEDDEKQAELIRRYLVVEGHEVWVEHDGLAALAAVAACEADLVVLDVMMPCMDGFEACRRLRHDGDTRVLMLTARASEGEMVHGLDLGADDYMTKPFSPRELVARTRALLRRGPARPAGEERLCVGALMVDGGAHEVLRDGEPVDLTPGEFAVLEHMARAPGRVFTRGQLLTILHGSDLHITARSVDMHVMNLRRKIEPDPTRPAQLVTVYGVGYKLVDRQQ